MEKAMNCREVYQRSAGGVCKNPDAGETYRRVGVLAYRRPGGSKTCFSTRLSWRGALEEVDDALLTPTRRYVSPSVG